MADALVEFDSVVKRFGDFTAVERMNCFPKAEQVINTSYFLVISR